MGWETWGRDLKPSAAFLPVTVPVLARLGKLKGPRGQQGGCGRAVCFLTQHRLGHVQLLTPGVHSLFSGESSQSFPYLFPSALAQSLSATCPCWWHPARRCELEPWHRTSSVPPAAPARRASTWVQQSPGQEEEGRETPGKGSSGLLRARLTLVPCKCSGAGTALLSSVPREPPWYPSPQAPQSRSGSSLEAKSLPASTTGCRIPSAASSFLSRHVCTQKQIQSGCWRHQPRALPFGVTSRLGAESSWLAGEQIPALAGTWQRRKTGPAAPCSPRQGKAK